MADRVRLDYAGIGRVLRSSEMAAAVQSAAGAVAAALPAGVQVTVDPHTTDRAAATIVVTGHTGPAESKSGMLATAASRAGLEYRGSA